MSREFGITLEDQETPRERYNIEQRKKKEEHGRDTAVQAALLKFLKNAPMPTRRVHLICPNFPSPMCPWGDAPDRSPQDWKEVYDLRTRIALHKRDLLLDQQAVTMAHNVALRSEGHADLLAVLNEEELPTEEMERNMARYGTADPELLRF